MSTDASTETDVRHVSGTIGLSDDQLAKATGSPNGNGTKALKADGIALAQENLFDFDGRVLRGARILHGVNTKKLRRVVHNDLTAAPDLAIEQGGTPIDDAYAELMKVAGYFAAALDAAADDSDDSSDATTLSTQATSLLLQTRAVLARRKGENLESDSGSTSGE